MAYVITSPCVDVKDGACVEECPQDCIYQGDRKMYINPNECTDCGACEPACPIGAISVDRRVPATDKGFIASELEFFTELLPGRKKPLGEMPGGAARFGVIHADTPFVAAYEA